MAKPVEDNRPRESGQRTLFDGAEPLSGDRPVVPDGNGTLPGVRAIQDLIWKEAWFALDAVEAHTDDAAFHEYLREHLPQNSRSTRSRYVQTLVRWFFPDGVRGLAARVWLAYQDRALAEEVLRYLYLRAEPMAGAAVADALLPIAENAIIPDSYLPNFLRARFGDGTPAKSSQRLKANLRKLGFLIKGKANRDTLRVPAPSVTGFLVVLHYLFAPRQAGAVEFRTLVADPFWKYLGFKNEDQVRTALKESLNRGLLAKYVLADRIESISFRYSFEEFVAGRLTA
jgi:hypothetical protein